MAFFALSIFLSAFLIFQIQPMIAKYILPWFGGSPAVWSSVMLFFQVLLTGGYAYAAWLANPARRRERVHLILLGVSAGLIFLLGFLWKSPITPSVGWKPHPSTFPALQIFGILLISVGLPYFLLSSNSPLIQAWFHRVFPEKGAYRLYALSNIGSLIALVSYPILVEPNLALASQGWTWSSAYLVFAGLAVVGSLRSLRSKTEIIQRQETLESVPAPKFKEYFLWISLAATASILLLAVTSQITQEVASIPFLWIVPLTIYLLSFIIAFEGERWYSRQVFLVIFAAATILASHDLGRSTAVPIWDQIGIYSLMLFVACMVCHGELYRLRPHPARLTTFYFMVSVGGALGGLVINFVAPYIFRGYWELPLGLFLCWLLYFLVVSLTRTARTKRWIWFADLTILLSMAAVTLVRSYQQIRVDLRTDLLIERNFYGVVRVREKFFNAVIPIHLGSIEQDLEGYDRFALVHGVTVHGYQFHDANLIDLPTSYYGEHGGAGLAILNSPRQGKGMRVGVLGLGVGTLAAYGQPGDVYRFYEINPLVIALARGQEGFFSYLSASKAKVEVVEGDARLSLENELAAGHPQNYDVLVLDVFSSDSIPVHLLDREAFEVYLKHLAPGGTLAVHITNSHLDLKPVVWTLADHFKLARVLVENPGDGVITYPSVWMLLARDSKVLAVDAITAAAEPMDGYAPHIRLWTDDYNNLFQILH